MAVDVSGPPSQQVCRDCMTCLMMRELRKITLVHVSHDTRSVLQHPSDELPPEWWWSVFPHHTANDMKAIPSSTHSPGIAFMLLSWRLASVNAIRPAKKEPSKGPSKYQVPITVCRARRER